MQIADPDAMYNATNISVMTDNAVVYLVLDKTIPYRGSVRGE